MSAPQQFNHGHFDGATVNRALTGTRFARRLQHFASIDSTSTLLLGAAAEGAPEGTVYVADEQTAGRGRGGHDWHSVAGDGLYVSVLIRPPLPLREALWISLATGLAAQRALHEAAALEIDIRWPNDLLLNGKKCGGILVETSVDGPNLRFAVIGIGININHSQLPPDLAKIATSLRIESGHMNSRERILIALLRALDLELTYLESNTAGLLERFTAASTWVRGKRVHVAEAGGYTGVTDGLDAHGFLQILGDDGRRRTVLSGGVREA
jgi:BirA family biotin operon repressor/biotin-[acetyl-CoA-carboxylase] ligase